MTHSIQFQIGNQNIEQISNYIPNEDSTKHPDKRKLKKFYTYVVKRSEDKRNMPTFSEISQLEMKHWILQKLFGKISLIIFIGEDKN